jgi:hypothetical protein
MQAAVNLKFSFARCLGLEDWHIFRPSMRNPNQRFPLASFDVISCLNVLDRCERPLTLLSQMRDCIPVDVGRIIVALVLPYKPFVELGKLHLMRLAFA